MTKRLHSFFPGEPSPLQNSKMIEPAQPQHPGSFRIRRLAVPAMMMLSVFFTALSGAAAAPSSFNLLDARERGTENTGAAKGSLVPTFDQGANQDVLELDYVLPKGSAIKVWTRSFPAGLGAARPNTAKIGVRVLSAEQAGQISVNFQIKGTKDVQDIPLRLKAGWNSFQGLIDWPKTGDLKEVVFVVAPAGNTDPAKGTLDFALDFISRSASTGQQVVAASAYQAPSVPKQARAAVTPRASSNRSPISSAKTNHAAAALPSHFNLLDAHEHGTEAAGSAKGTVTSTVDEAADKDILEFDYELAQGSELRVWTRKFPAGLGAASVNTVKTGIRVLGPGQADQISLKLEIKGAKDIQVVPLRLKSGWNSVQEPVDWEKIGDLSEVDFVAAPKGKAQSVKGTLNLALDFVKQSSINNTKAAKDLFSVYSLWDATEKGVFNIGPSKGNVSTAFDETMGKDVWKFDYLVPEGSIVGVWTKSYPLDLRAVTADAVRIGVQVPDPDQLNQVSVKVEIKGKQSMQSVPLTLKPGWNSFREFINWNTIGDLNEVVFVVSPTVVNSTSSKPVWFSPTQAGPAQTAVKESVKPLTGALYFTLDFGRITFLEKYAIFVKVGWVAAMSFLAALISVFLGRIFSRDHVFRDPPLSWLNPDFFWGMMTVLIAGVALRIYSLGMMGPLDAGFSFNFLALGLAGALIAEMLKSRITGRHLTPAEVFQNILLTGLLAASSSRLELLQAPATWGQVLMINKLTAAAAFLVYHVFNAFSLSSSGKHVKAIPGTLMVATPYLFGWLLLLENATLLQKLMNGITLGMLAAWPAVLEAAGRVLVVFGFNEVVTNGIGLVMKGKILKTSKAHGFIFLVSLGVVIAPLIADLGSTALGASLPVAVKAAVGVLTTMFSFAGLWAEVYLITGILLDGGHRAAPSWETVFKHVSAGARKGMAYSGILMAILYLLNVLLNHALLQKFMSVFPVMVGIVSGALVFPFIKTVIETFDGSLPFFERTRYSYRSGTLYARGAVVGYGFAYMITQGMFQRAMPDRILFGLLIGFLASGGMSFLRDVVYALRGQGRVQSWRLYLVDSLLGIFVGSATAFYLDSAQVPVIVEKFKLYNSSGLSPVEYMTYPLINKWGRIDLGSYTGGVKLIFLESLAGVINWSVAAWLFAINKVFMQAYFDKDKTPIKFFFSKAGFAQLIEHMIYVLRWGLWMSPIIFTFLRMMPQPAWYNQDGAIRTLVTIYHNLTMSPAAFQAWSLQVFIYVMAFDFFRILIWMDHMGLRVATLVNLSFLGVDKLDERVARFIGPAAAQRYIPEGVKRFTTWAPLLIPFYLPRGEAWDYAWSTSEAMQNAARGKGMLSFLHSLTFFQMILFLAAAVLVCMGISFCVRWLLSRSRGRRIKSYELANREYKVVLKENGEVYSELLSKECDISRRSYDTMDPCGRVLYLVDASEQGHNGSRTRFWPVVGNFPKEKFELSRMERDDDCLKIVNSNHGVRTTVKINLPDQDSTVELWEVMVENLREEPRDLKLIPYLEWVLNGGLHDRFHTQYARLYPEMEYVNGANAVLSWQKSTKSMGILASDVPPEGFLTSRVDFIGRAQSIWSPRVLDTLDFRDARDSAFCPTFDPIGSLMVNAQLAPRGSKTVRFMIGYAKNEVMALDLISKHLKPKAARTFFSREKEKKTLLIGHGEIPPGTPRPYFEYLDQGNKLLVHTPFTPRPFDHTMSNAIHSVMVTNRGLHCSCNGNSQQNRLTPDWPDTVTKEMPAEAIYLYDPDQKEWYSPTYHPLNDQHAKLESEFSVDGTAVFRMTRGTVSTELVVFVPPEDPAGVYLLTVKNRGRHPKRMRIAPYFQMVLAFQPEKSGPLQMHHDKTSNALFFENPRNIFRSGWAFAAMSIPADCVETKRGRFFGRGRGFTHPFMVENGEPDTTQLTDDGQIAGFLGTVEIPAQGECTVAIVLGQADQRKQAAELVRKYKNIETVRMNLEHTQKWWSSLMGTLEVETNQPDFDRFQNWLKYQALAERIWARRGFYQTSGAYGFRDQLQDTVNLIWVDPALARRQIILHASQQFLEGDVFHWFFTLTDGRTAFSCRSHASDNPVWLAWGVVEYVRATGDDSILDEMTSYVFSEFPFAALPKNKQGWGHLYHRTTKADSVYRHCLKSIDLVLEKRMGKHGLPLIQTGDWNDGLDEIGSEGKGESVWLGFFLYYILKEMVHIVDKKEGTRRKEHYLKKMQDLKEALELTWRGDRYLRAIHDDGTEIGVKDSGVWEIDALTAAWAVIAGINFDRGRVIFQTALRTLEKENTLLLGWPALREDTKPYLGRSSKYPEGVRENGMYCHGVQWLVKAARVLAEESEKRGERVQASHYRQTAYNLWLKISPIPHVNPEEIELYGGQPNKQAADLLTTFDQGRMIWHGYTGAAGWMLREAMEGVIGAALIHNELLLPEDLETPRGELKVTRVHRDVSKSPLHAKSALSDRSPKTSGAASSRQLTLAIE